MSNNAASNSPRLSINNRKAGFSYELLQTFEAGMVLLGSEIKSIRQAKVNMGDAYCLFLDRDLYVRNLHISAYKEASWLNHEPMRDKKLLLKRHELRKLEHRIKEKGYTVVPTRLFISERGFAKLEIALARGKKQYDKRESIKDRVVERDLRRESD
jgi:SsrA-binding protein